MRERLWISEGSYGEMLYQARQYYPLETGGMLLGYEADNGEAVITAVLGPGPNARHQGSRFSPDAAYQQERLEAHFRRTEGQETYLGDWHTHPRGSAALSRLDKRTLARIAITESSQTKLPIMVVLAGGTETWELVGVRFLTFRRPLFFPKYELAYLEPRVFEKRATVMVS